MYIHSPSLRVQKHPQTPYKKGRYVGMVNRKRDHQILISMTEKEKKKFDEEYSKTRCKSRADFVMALIDDKPIIVIKDIIPVLAELRYQGNNLNQIAHKLNATGSINSAAMRDLIKRWAEAYDKLISIALEVNEGAVARREKQ